jgi:hypothetical protein
LKTGRDLIATLTVSPEGDLPSTYSPLCAAAVPLKLTTAINNNALTTEKKGILITKARFF